MQQDFFNSSFINKHQGEVGIVLGTGPSIREYDLTDPFFRDNVTIGANAIGKIFAPTYYFISDKEAIPLFWPEIRRLGETEHCQQFFIGKWIVHRIMREYPTSQVRPIMDRATVVNYDFRDRIGPPTPGRIFHGRTTGVVMLHLAWHMGFKYIFMLGMDGYTCVSSGQPSHFYANLSQADWNTTIGTDEVVNANVERFFLACRAAGRYLWSLSPVSVHGGFAPIWPGVRQHPEFIDYDA